MKKAYIIPLLVFAVLLGHRFLNANMGVDWQDLAIINSILLNGQIPPVNPWLLNTTTVYQYGYHLFTAVICHVSGVPPEIAVNTIIPFSIFLLLLGVYSLAKDLTGDSTTGIFSQTLSVSGSLIGILFLLFLLNNPLPSDEGLWTLGKVPLPFDAPERVTDNVNIENNILSTNTFLPFPSTYFITGTSFCFAFMFFIFTVNLLLNNKHTLLTAISLTTLLLIYPFMYVLLAAALVLYMGIKTYLTEKLVVTHLPALALSAVFAVPRLLEMSSTMWYPYLQTYSLGILALYFGPMLLFFIIGIATLHKENKLTEDKHLLILTIILAAFLIISTVFPLQQGIADRKHLVPTWFLMSIIASIGITKLLRINWQMMHVIVPFLVIGLLSPTLMIAYDLQTTTVETNSTIGYFQAGSSGIQTNTLNGLAWIETYYPEEYEALQWIKQNTPENATILEAYEEKYLFKPLNPSITGRKAYVGWYGFLEQQGLWTEGYRELVDLAYEGEPKSCKDKQCAFYMPDVDYVWYGPTEVDRYGEISRLVDLWELHEVFKNNKVTIYEIPK